MKKRVHQSIVNLFRRIPFSRLRHHLCLDRGQLFAEMVAIDSRGRSEYHLFYRTSQAAFQNVERPFHICPIDKFGVFQRSVNAHHSRQMTTSSGPGNLLVSLELIKYAPLKQLEFRICHVLSNTR